MAAAHTHHAVAAGIDFQKGSIMFWLFKFLVHGSLKQPLYPRSARKAFGY